MPFALILLSLNACEQQVTVDTGQAEGGRIITVSADGVSAQLALDELPTIHPEDDDVVAVTAVLDASGLGTDWASRGYAFVASDGFTPADVGCDPVDYSAVQSAWLYPSSGNLVWDGALDMRGCYFVNDIATVQVLDAE